MDPQQIIGNFQLEGTVRSIEPHGNGYINDTFHIRMSAPEGQEYLLQKINHYVFRDVEGLMNNIDLVTRHIRSKLEQRGVKDIERRVLQIYKTKTGRLYFKDGDGQYWRVFNFVKDHVAYDRAPDNEVAYEGARMFGQFLYDLADLEPAKLVDTIPNFHNILWRLENLEKAIKEDSAGRVQEVKEEIAYARKSAGIMSVIQRLGEKGAIPARVVHNDTKINNVLFDKNKKGLCVIDLDTVMAGYAHYDFGDGIRTSVNPADEDEADLSKVQFDLEIFKAFSAGYLEAVRSLLTQKELETLPYAALLFPFIMGVRFLTDYISGDVYYKIQYPDQNLRRARAQLKLAQEGEKRMQDMQQIISKLS